MLWPTLNFIYTILYIVGIFSTSFALFRVNITYITKDGQRISVHGKVGDNVMYLAHRHNIEIEGKTGNSYIHSEINALLNVHSSSLFKEMTL